MAGFTVLVVESDRVVAEALTAGLDERGYQVRVASRGGGALEALDPDLPDLVLLDLNLPDMDSLDACRRVRALSNNPIIVMSARSSEERIIAALDAGADAHVAKPLSIPELLAHIRVAERHRRLAAAVDDNDTIIVIGDLMIDTGAHEVRVAGTTVSLTRKEFALLTLLARNEGRVLTHRAILEHIWGADNGAVPSLRVHITKLRRALATGAAIPRIICTPGTGYRLTGTDPLRVAEAEGAQSRPG